MPINDMGGEKLPPPRYPKLRTKNGIPLHCDKCNYDWIYSGKKKHYGYCPRCHNPVRFSPYGPLDIRRIKIEDRGDLPLRQFKHCNYIWVFKGHCRYPSCPKCFRKKTIELTNGTIPPPNTTNHNMTCQHCGHTWVSRKEDPLKCPLCTKLLRSPQKKPKIKVEKKKKNPKPQISITCQRCGRRWGYTGNSNGPHIGCPTCGTSIPNPLRKKEYPLPSLEEPKNKLVLSYEPTYED